MIRTARARFPDAEIRSLSLPRGGNGLITLRMKRPAEWLPNGRTTIWFAAGDGRLVAARNAEDLPRTVRAYNLLYPLHAAEVGGLPLRLLMTLSGLALDLLVQAPPGPATEASPRVIGKPGWSVFQAGPQAEHFAG
jgi:uncharacterized iron-regulated membrane protein